MFLVCWLLSILCTLCTCSQVLDCSGSVKAKTTTLKLKRDLLCGYDKYNRPVPHHTNRTTVDTVMAPRVITFDDVHSTFNIKSWLSMNWEDFHLTWDKLQYDNIDILHLDTSMVWVPDLSIYNGQKETSVDQMIAPVVAHNRGKVYAFISPEISGHCMPDWANWPFDVHTCTIQMGSLSYLGSSLNFNKPVLTMKFILQHKDWEILSTKSYRNETNLGSKNETDSTFLVNMNFQFKLRRHSSVYVASYVIPGVEEGVSYTNNFDVLSCVLLVSASSEPTIFIVMMIMSLGLLWIPSHNVERTAILCTLVIIQSLYLQYLAYQIPTNGDKTPFIVCFYRDCLILTGLLLIETLVTRSMESWKTNPSFLHKVFNIIAANRVLQYIFVNDLDPKSAAKLMEVSNEEGSNLVTSGENTQQWKMFVTITHRVLFLLLLPTYILLSLNLMPLNYSIANTLGQIQGGNVRQCENERSAATTRSAAGYAAVFNKTTLLLMEDVIYAVRPPLTAIFPSV